MGTNATPEVDSNKELGDLFAAIAKGERILVPKTEGVEFDNVERVLRATFNTLVAPLTAKGRKSIPDEIVRALTINIKEPFVSELGPEELLSKLKKITVPIEIESN